MSRYVLLAACVVALIAGCDRRPPGSDATPIQAAMADCALEALANHPRDNLARSEQYLSCTGQLDGVVTTDTGLQYQVLESGDPRMSPPANGQYVCVHYRGTLIDGSEFDSSYTRDAPAAFPSNQLIPGWVEALASMRPGESRQLLIHPNLGYGSSGAGASIGPNEALIFEMSLLKVMSSPRDSCP